MCMVMLLVRKHYVRLLSNIYQYTIIYTVCMVILKHKQPICKHLLLYDENT